MIGVECFVVGGVLVVVGMGVVNIRLVVVYVVYVVKVGVVGLMLIFRVLFCGLLVNV